MALRPACDAGHTRKSWTVRTADGYWNVVELHIFDNERTRSGWLGIGVMCGADASRSVGDSRVEEGHGSNGDIAAATRGHVQTNSAVVDINL